MNRWKKWVKELAVMAVTVMIAATVMGYLRAPAYEGANVPPLQAETVDGTVFDSAAPKKPYLLHFWATWCPVCRAEAGNIDALAETENVIAVAVNSGDDEALKAYLGEKGLTYPVINDEESAIASAFKISVFPTTIIVGKDGKVFWAESGYTTTWGLKFRLWLAELF